MKSTTTTKNLRKALENKSQDIIESAMEHGRQVALEGYRTAEYDGPAKAIEVEWYRTEKGYSLQSRGQGVRAIEYGARGGNTSSTRFYHSGGDAFWFYPIEPGNEFNAGGRYKFKTRSVIAKKNIRLDKNKRPVRLSNGELSYLYTRLSDERIKQEAKLEGISEKQYRKENITYIDAKGGPTRDINKASKEDDQRYGYTQGNKPNNVMLNARRAIVEYLRSY